MKTIAMAVSTSTAATSAAASANAQAIGATRLSCTSYVRGYEHDRAKVTEMREYAGCVGHLHPDQITGESLAVAKFAVLLMFAAILAGFVWERRNNTMGEGWINAVVWGGLAGFGCGCLGLLAAAGVWFVVRLLLA
jgi:hypothetical protein